MPVRSRIGRNRAPRLWLGSTGLAGASEFDITASRAQNKEFHGTDRLSVGTLHDLVATSRGHEQRRAVQVRTPGQNS